MTLEQMQVAVDQGFGMFIEDLMVQFFSHHDMLGYQGYCVEHGLEPYA